MNDNDDLTFLQLRCKDVIDSNDGKNLGKVCDIVLDKNLGKMKGIIIPYGKKGWFCREQELFVPWRCILKLGEDVIIVDLTPKKDDGAERLPPVGVGEITDNNCCSESKAEVKPDCDMKCDKCMILDCGYRWKDI